jgi:hypothetical protein
MIKSTGGTVELRPNPNRKLASPNLFEVGQGPTGFLVFGVPINLATQLPFPTDALTGERGTIEEWFFADPHVPVILTLRDFEQQVRKLIADIAQVAAL